jgi:hypothetical protein
MANLKFSAHALGIHEIGKRRASQQYGFLENFPNASVEARDFGALERCCQARGMDARPPQAFIAIDVAHAAENMLIEQKRLYPRTAAAQTMREFLLAYLERLRAERAKNLRQLPRCGHLHPAEPARVGVAQFATIIETQEDMRVGRNLLFRWANRELARHPQMHQQKQPFTPQTCWLKREMEEFPGALDGQKSRAGKALREDLGILDEIRFPETHFHDYSSGQCPP